MAGIKVGFFEENINTRKVRGALRVKSKTPLVNNLELPCITTNSKIQRVHPVIKHTI